MEENKENVPKIRFPEFTDPWEQRKLEKEFYKVNERNDGSFGKEHWISVAKMYFQDPEKVQSNNIDTRTYVMRFGDIAFEGHPNQEFKFGRFVANDIGEGVVSELFPIYRHKQEYDNDFWKRAIQLERIMAPIFAKAITSSGNSSNKLDEKHFLRECIPVPTISEQKQIGTFFRQLDKLITLHQRKLEHLQDKKKVLLQKMFPKDGGKFPELRFPGFIEPWEQRKFSDDYKINSGYAFKAVDYEKNGIPIINGESIQHGNINDSNLKYLPHEFVNKYKDFILKTNDIVVGLNRPITNGKLKIAQIPAELDGSLLYQRAGKVKILNETNVNFAFIILEKEIHNYTLQEAIGSDQPFISTSKLDKWCIICPKDKMEQTLIGTFFREFDDLITLHQRKLEHLQQQKKGLLQQMFV